MRRRLAILAALALTPLFAACPEKAPPAPPSLAFDPGAACRECHPAIADSYRRTGMARALGPIAPGELAGLAPVDDDGTGLRYRFADSRLVESFAGAEISYPLVFGIGAGLMDRSFAARRGDLLWFAPLEVVTTPRHAALAPGHSMRPGLRLTVPITEECLSCHTDALPPRGYPLNLDPGNAWAPHGISCAACHGDVERHVECQRKSLPGDPILSFEKAPAIERMSVCARCHLQGDASLPLAAGERGVPPPGGDLLARRAVFVASKTSSDIGFVSHVERLVLSRCFIESLKKPPGLTCQTCHDPHRSCFDEEERRSVRDACGRCHSDCPVPRAERGVKDCVDCHMRATPPFDVGALTIRDHDIVRRPPPPSSIAKLRVKESEGGAIALFRWPGTVMPPHTDDAGLRMMGERAAGHDDRALALVDAAPGPVAKSLPMYHHLRATLLEQVGRTADAAAAYGEALRLDPDQAESSVNLALVLSSPESIALLDRVLARHPRAEGALRNRAVAKLKLGDRAGFASDLEAAFAILPHAASARALADYWKRAGDAARASKWALEASRLDPPGR